MVHHDHNFALALSECSNGCDYSVWGAYCTHCRYHTAHSEHYHEESKRALLSHLCSQSNSPPCRTQVQRTAASTCEEGVCQLQARTTRRQGCKSPRSEALHVHAAIEAEAQAEVGDYVGNCDIGLGRRALAADTAVLGDPSCSHAEEAVWIFHRGYCSPSVAEAAVERQAQLVLMRAAAAGEGCCTGAWLDPEGKSAVAV